MPYISKEDRLKFNSLLNEFTVCGVSSPGEMNYVFTRMLQIYLQSKGESYATHNEITGLLENVKQEWYRRKTSEYENRKILQNGDV